MTNLKENTNLKEQIVSMLDNTILDWDKPSMLTDMKAKPIYDRLVPAIEKLVHQARVQAVEEYKITEQIERLDIQCLEGNCRNCDSRRPLLAELNKKLKELESKEVE